MLTRLAAILAALVLGCGVAARGKDAPATRPASGPSTRATGYAAYIEKTMPLVNSLGELRKVMDRNITDEKNAREFAEKIKALNKAAEVWRKGLSEDELAYPSAAAIDEAWRTYAADAIFWIEMFEAKARSEKLKENGNTSGALTASEEATRILGELLKDRLNAEKRYTEARRLLKTKEGSKPLNPE